MNVLLFILIAYGFSNIVVFGSIFKAPRDFMNEKSPKFFGMLVSCMMCFPTWVGFLLSVTYFSPTLYYGLTDLWGVPKEYLSIFFDGVLASGTTWLIHSVQEMTERAFNE